MKHNKIFRLWGVLLSVLLLVCGFSLTAHASDGGELYTTEQTEQTEPSDEPTITIPEETTEAPTYAFTPDGNMTLIDNVEGEDEGKKQFIIVQSKNGHYFYIVIDYAAEGENTVHFLNQVDEADLMDILAKEEITLPPTECTCADKCAVGAIDTTCPVCIAAMSECAAAEEAPPTDDTNTEQPPADDTAQGLNVGVIVAVVVVLGLAGGGIFYYFKVMKPKKQNNAPASRELSELEYDDYDEDEEYTDALEDIADELNEEREEDDI